MEGTKADIFMYVSMFRIKVRCRAGPDVGLYDFPNFDPMPGRYPKNVGMLDVLMILSCVCYLYVSGLWCDAGAVPKECLYASEFRSDAGAGPDECLYVYD